MACPLYMVNNTSTLNIQETDQRARLEIIGTVLLAIASLIVAWCTYQSTLWNGEQDFRMAEANICYRRANEFTVLAAQKRELDAAVTLSFMDAVIEKRQDKITYFLNRSNPQLASILSTWLATKPLQNPNAPAHPLEMATYKSLMQASKKSSDSAMRLAEALWQEAKKSNHTSDSYTLYTVIFSLVMFLCAVCTKLTRLRLAYTTMIFAGTILLLTLILLVINMPVARLTP